MKITLTFDSMKEFEEFTGQARLGAAITEAAEKQGKTIEKQEPVKTEAVEEPTVEEPTAEEPKAPTVEEVRAKLNELAKEKGKEAVKELFKSFGAANFTKIKPEDYGAVLKAAEEGLNG